MHLQSIQTRPIHYTDIRDDVVLTSLALRLRLRLRLVLYSTYCNILMHRSYTYIIQHKLLDDIAQSIQPFRLLRWMLPNGVNTKFNSRGASGTLKISDHGRFYVGGRGDTPLPPDSLAAPADSKAIADCSDPSRPLASK